MKKLIIKILFLSLLFSFNIQAQNYPYQGINEISSAVASGNYTYGGGGYAIPSTGSFHMLIIFAEFPDDNYDVNNNRWIKGNPPQNMTGWIDQTWSTTPTQGSLTHYFNVMSLNRFRVTGETMHIIAPRTRSQYQSLGWKRGQIQREILQAIDASKDFAGYLKQTGLQHIRTSIAYPQNNGKIERYDRTIHEECLMRKSLINLDDARKSAKAGLSLSTTIPNGYTARCFI